MRRDTNEIVLKIQKRDGLVLKDLILGTAKTWRLYETTPPPKDGGPCFHFCITNKRLKDYLLTNDYGIKSGASACKILSCIPESLKHYWWRGYFDGDGSIIHSARKTEMSITSCYNQDWTFFNNLAATLDLVFRVERNRSEARAASVIRMWRRKSLLAFMAYIYQGNDFGLTRKKVRYDSLRALIKQRLDNKSSPYRGVWFSKYAQAYIAEIKFQRVKTHVGTFKCPLEAARARDSKVRELKLGLVLNFP